MVDPGVMCNRHLLGEHVELHMLVKTINLGKSIKGYLNGLVDPNLTLERHEKIVEEMKRRGMNHHSPIDSPVSASFGCSIKPISETVNRKELAGRCARCSFLMANSQEDNRGVDN